MNFCSHCGSGLVVDIPDGDNRPRHICTNANCGTIHYQNPKIITGCLPTFNDKVLLCKRAIEPRYGLWTLPAGFMENGETTEQGALRETWEEAKARCAIQSLYAIYDLPHINQVYFFYHAELENGGYGAGEESLEVALFAENEIPWGELAFPVVTETLKSYFEDRKTKTLLFRQKTINRKKPLNKPANRYN